MSALNYEHTCILLPWPCDCSYFGDNCESTSTSKSKKDIIMLFSAGAAVLFIAALACVYRVYLYYQYYRPHNFQLEIEAVRTALAETWHVNEEGNIPADELSLLHFLPPPREISRSCLRLTNPLGEGQFGEVWEAVLNEAQYGGDSDKMVAVKKIKSQLSDVDNAVATKELHREAAVMAVVPAHDNVVSIIGVVTRGSPHLLVVAYVH